MHSPRSWSLFITLLLLYLLWRSKDKYVTTGVSWWWGVSMSLLNHSLFLEFFLKLNIANWAILSTPRDTRLQSPSRREANRWSKLLGTEFISRPWLNVPLNLLQILLMLSLTCFMISIIFPVNESSPIIVDAADFILVFQTVLSIFFFLFLIIWKSSFIT